MADTDHKLFQLLQEGSRMHLYLDHKHRIWILSNHNCKVCIRQLHFRILQKNENKNARSVYKKPLIDIRKIQKKKNQTEFNSSEILHLPYSCQDISEDISMYIINYRHGTVNIFFPHTCFYSHKTQLSDHIPQTTIRICCNHRLCIDRIRDFHSNHPYIGYNSNQRCCPNIVSILRSGDHTNWEHKYWRFRCNDKVYNSLRFVKDFQNNHYHTFRNEVLRSLLDMRCKYILEKKRSEEF